MNDPGKAPKRTGSAPDTPGTSARPRLRRPPRKAFDAVILLVILGFIAYGMFRFYDEILKVLFSRTATVVVVLLVIEFLILKSVDRTRLYRLENRRLARRRMADLQAMREAESALANLISEPPLSPAEILRRRQLKGSMVAEDGEEDPNRTPLESAAGAAEGTTTPTSSVPEPAEAPPPGAVPTPASPGPDALHGARCALRHIRQRLY